MSNTRRFKLLQRRILSIETSFLPDIDPTGNYTGKQQDDIRAYIMLSHAEIESYFEDTVEEKVKKAFLTWKANRKKSNVLLALVSFNPLSTQEPVLESRVNKALTSYLGKLRFNNGIKDKDIIEMLMPIGVEYDTLDRAWLNTISSFGVKRGDVAHKGANVQQVLDPSTLKNTIQIVINGIQDLDRKIQSLI